MFIFVFQFAWLPLERKTPLKEPFLTGDGFDIYVDGCRYLPDSVTFTKVYKYFHLININILPLVCIEIYLVEI